MNIDLIFQVVAGIFVVGGLVWFLALFSIADDLRDYCAGVYHYFFVYILVGMGFVWYGASFEVVAPDPAVLALDALCWPWEVLKVFVPACNTV